VSALTIPCDRGAALACAGGKAAHPRLLLAATILASSLAFIDGSVVNVGLPAVAKSLGVGGALLPWVINAYLLPLTALLLFGGAAGDRFGRRRLLIIGILIYVYVASRIAAPLARRNPVPSTNFAAEPIACGTLKSQRWWSLENSAPWPARIWRNSPMTATRIA